jgi:hypothetical protein
MLHSAPGARDAQIQTNKKKLQTDPKNRKPQKNQFSLCVWMFFCKNRWIGSDFELIFQNRSKPNPTKPHTNILILINRLKIYCIKLFFVHIFYYLLIFVNTIC